MLSANKNEIMSDIVWVIMHKLYTDKAQIPVVIASTMCVSSEFPYVFDEYKVTSNRVPLAKPLIVYSIMTLVVFVSSGKITVNQIFVPFCLYCNTNVCLIPPSYPVLHCKVKE